uniref:Retrovirus-related Pol polyprotein from transposon TNT 1-94-like beta-barrel domain-containing protein n=1 Tax=Tanacetum cinerariifolium TaxID=118510 RepID=A0A699H5B2_TANCI|nr:hypothetical protein [Tanacetum cinerariifolium]
MSTSNVHQQSLADVVFKTRPPILERSSYISWASHFRRYLNRKRETRKWLSKAIDEGPYEFRIFTPSKTEAPRLQKEEDLRGDDLKHYEAEIEAMNLILISIPKDIYNSEDACTTTKSIEKKLDKSHDPLELVAHTGSSSRNSSPYYVTHPSSMFNYDHDYQRDKVQNNSDDLITSAMILLAHVITRNFSNPTNNRLRTSSNTRNQAIVQGDRMLLAKQDEAEVILTDEQNDFLFTDASRMDEIDELSANIFLMARIQPTTLILILGQAMILHFLVRNAYNEAEKQQIIDKKVQQQNIMLTKQLELYKEKVWVFEITKEKTNNYFNEYIEADRKAKQFEQESQSYFIHDRDIIRDLEQHRDKLDLNVVELKKQTVELQKTKSILKRKMSENKDQYHDTVLNLEAKVKKNVDTVLKIRNSLQGMFMLGQKPMSFYDSKLKHGLGYANPYTLKKEISQNPKLYDASCLDDSKIHMNIRDTEEILKDATKTQIKMKNKMKDPIAIEKKRNVSTIDYHKFNALYKDVPQKELSAEQKYFHHLLYLLTIIQMKFQHSGCSKHITGDRSLLKNCIEIFMGTVRFENDHFTTITRYGDYVQGNITICHVYYVEGLGHNLFSVGKFYDSDLEVAFRSNMLRALLHLDFGTINDLTKHDLVDGLPKFKYSIYHLCSACERGKKSMNTLSKEDLDNLFGPMFDEYFEKKSSDLPINFAAQQVHNKEDSPMTTSIDIEEHEAPPINYSYLGLRKKYRLSLKNAMPPRDKFITGYRMEHPNITMEEYIRLEEEKARRHAIVFNDELSSEKTLSCEPTLSSLNNNEIDFRISFDEFDDEDYTIIFDKNSFSYKIISVNDLKLDLENDNEKVNMPSFPSPEPKNGKVKFCNLCTYLVDFLAMTPRPPRDQRHLCLRYQVEGYTEEIVHDFEDRLETIFER